MSRSLLFTRTLLVCITFAACEAAAAAREDSSFPDASGPSPSDSAFMSASDGGRPDVSLEAADARPASPDAPPLADARTNDASDASATLIPDAPSVASCVTGPVEIANFPARTRVGQNAAALFWRTNHWLAVIERTNETRFYVIAADGRVLHQSVGPHIDEYSRYFMLGDDLVVFSRIFVQRLRVTPNGVVTAYDQVRLADFIDPTAVQETPGVAPTWDAVSTSVSSDAEDDGSSVIRVALDDRARTGLLVSTLVANGLAEAFGGLQPGESHWFTTKGNQFFGLETIYGTDEPLEWRVIEGTFTPRGGQLDFTASRTRSWTESVLERAYAFHFETQSLVGAVWVGGELIARVIKVANDPSALASFSDHKVQALDVSGSQIVFATQSGMGRVALGVDHATPLASSPVTQIRLDADLNASIAIASDSAHPAAMYADEDDAGLFPTVETFYLRCAPASPPDR